MEDDHIDGQISWLARKYGFKIQLGVKPIRETLHQGAGTGVPCSWVELGHDGHTLRGGGKDVLLAGGGHHISGGCGSTASEITDGMVSRNFTGT